MFFFIRRTHPLLQGRDYLFKHFVAFFQKAVHYDFIVLILFEILLTLHIVGLFIVVWYNYSIPRKVCYDVIYFTCIIISCRFVGCIYPYSYSQRWLHSMGLLPDTQNCGLRMRQECRERFPGHRLQRKLLVSDPSHRSKTAQDFVGVVRGLRLALPSYYV